MLVGKQPNVKNKPLFLAHNMKNKIKRKCEYSDVWKALKP